MCGLYSDKQNGMASMMNALEKLFLLISVMCQMQEGSFDIFCEVQARSPDTFLCNP